MIPSHKFSSIAIIFFLISLLGLQAQNLEWDLTFSDDFQVGFGSQWIFEGEWFVEKEEANFFMHGSNHQFVECRDGAHWYNCKLQFKLKIDSGTIHINNHLYEGSRFFTGISASEEGGFMYVRQSVDNGEDYLEKTLFEGEIGFSEKVWHDVEIVTIDDTIWITIDQQEILKATSPIPTNSGTIAFESLENSSISVDNVLVYIEREEQYNEDTPWIKTGGPIGGLGYDIRIHPEDKNIMLVTDNPSGVNKSYDGGESWHTRNTGLTSGSQIGAPIFSLTIDPVNPDIVWCGTQNFKGIYRSEDQGETWSKKDNGIIDDGISFRGFAIHPENSDIVYAAAELGTLKNGIEFNMTKGKIYRTQDAGENWETVWSGDNMARVLLFNYLHPDTIYCSTGLFDREAYNEDIEAGIPGGEGIVKSTDGGKNWSNINTGLDNLYCGNLAMHPTNPEILFTPTGNNAWSYPPNNQPGGVFRTNNGGLLWEKVLGADLENNELFAFVAISPSDPDIVYAGSYIAIYRSEDGGDTWTRMAKENGEGYGPEGINAGFPISAVVDPDDPYVLFINNYGGGNFVSYNGGISWKNASVGYTGAEIHALAVSKSNDALIYTNAKSGAFSSHNGGQQWEGIQHGESISGAAFSISVNPLNDQSIFASNEHDGTILKSNNGGYNWITAYNNPVANAEQVEDRQGYKTITFAPSDTTIAYAGGIMASSLSNDYYDVTGIGVAKSIDGGFTWNVHNGDLPIDAYHIADLAISPNDANLVYLASYFDGIYKTSNGGDNWTEINQGLSSTDIRSICIDPNNEDILFVGTASGAGIYKSIDGGLNFEAANKGILLKSANMIPSKHVMQQLQGKITGAALGVRPTEYASNNWSRIMDIVIDPTNSDRIYIADFVSGVYTSADGGATWTSMNKGFPNKNVICLDLSVDGSVLYLGTYEAGIFRYVTNNKTPQSQATIPENNESIVLYKDETFPVEVFAFDLNEDSIMYQWYFDNVLIAGEEQALFTLSGFNYAIGEHTLKVTISDHELSSSESWQINLLESTTALAEGVKNKDILSVSPNPILRSKNTTIQFYLNKSSQVKISLYDLQGRLLNTIVSEEKEAGTHYLSWNPLGKSGTPLASGTYIIKLENNIQNRSIKLVIK